MSEPLLTIEVFREDGEFIVRDVETSREGRYAYLVVAFEDLAECLMQYHRALADANGRSPRLDNHYRVLDAIFGKQSA